jgi:hypothetical protein
MRKVAEEQLIDKVDRPDDKMEDHQDQGMVVIPAYQNGINAQK